MKIFIVCIDFVSWAAQTEILVEKLIKQDERRERRNAVILVSYASLSLHGEWEYSGDETFFPAHTNTDDMKTFVGRQNYCIEKKTSRTRIVKQLKIGFFSYSVIY